ncbi:MAG TPA: HNH endonuclease, partial [Pyrinomonadaceae bacterium]|nr:HNH endonuclease [Pyrinomonadaceae bacterium]
KNYLSAIVPLLPDKYSPIQDNGDGNQKCYLAFIAEDLANLLLSIAQSYNAGVRELVEDAEQSVLDEIAEVDVRKQQLSETEREQLIKARRGQGLFRSNVEGVEKGCRLTGVDDKRFLIAGHIKPWRVSDNSERLDGNNGLLLSPHVDRLFDKGCISFSDHGQVLCSSDSVELLMKTWGLNPKKNVGSFNKYQELYLDYHRRRVCKNFCVTGSSFTATSAHRSGS